MKTIQAVPGSEEYQARIDEIHDKLRDYQDNPRLAQSPEEVEKLEQEIRDLTEGNRSPPPLQILTENQ
jgi:polyhydroxyalkanoate synthesis regulator phasin